MLNWSSKILKRIQGACLQGIWQLHKTSCCSLNYYTVCNSIRKRPFVFYCYVFCQATSKTESRLSFCLFPVLSWKTRFFFLFPHCSKMYSVSCITTKHLLNVYKFVTHFNNIGLISIWDFLPLTSVRKKTSANLHFCLLYFVVKM